MFLHFQDISSLLSSKKLTCMAPITTVCAATAAKPSMCAPRSL